MCNLDGIDGVGGVGAAPALGEWVDVAVEEACGPSINFAKDAARSIPAQQCYEQGYDAGFKDIKYSVSTRAGGGMCASMTARMTCVERQERSVGMPEIPAKPTVSASPTETLMQDAPIIETSPAASEATKSKVATSTSIGTEGTKEQEGGSLLDGFAAGAHTAIGNEDSDIRNNAASAWDLLK